MPGARQNIRSAPQKQPMPKMARSVPSGKGGPIGVPRTRCRPGTTIGVSRPGSASSGVGIAAGLRVKSMGERYRAGSDSGREHLVAGCADELRPASQPKALVGKLASYGWSRFEGRLLYNEHVTLEAGKLVPPVYVYSHGSCGVIGGYVYAAPACRGLEGGTSSEISAPGFSG